MSSPSQRPDPFAALNPDQRAAVEHGIDAPGLLGAPLLVIAGAGSGKTLTLASRVARLVLAGADPQRILLLTFSRRAAREMEARVGRVLHQALGYGANQRPPALPWAGTFHAVSARLLREYAPRIGLAESFVIADRGDSEDLMGLARDGLGLGQTRGRQRFPQKGTCLAIYSRAVNSATPLSAVLAGFFPWCAAHEAELGRLFDAYLAGKQRQQLLDFDDLLLYWAELMADPVLGAHLRSRFDQVLVDEYQDTSRIQESILLGLKPDGRGLTVVGDDAQSIYSFRAAEVHNILGFPQRFEPPARIVTLDRNYRSTQPILQASNAVIARAAQRFAKNLWTDRVSSARPQLVSVEDEGAQARWVVDSVLERREEGLALKAQAVLFRASHHSAPVELELARRNVPFVKFGGLQFLEAAHIKDVLAVLRWAENPRNHLAGSRVARLVPGIGATTTQRLLDSLDGAADPAAGLQAFRPPATAAADWQQLLDLMARLGRQPPGWPDDIDAAVGWYRPHLERLHDDHEVRAADLDQLARLARATPSRQQFLTDLALDPPAATSDLAGPPLLDEDYLILSTIHAAKGLEWQSVCVLNAVDGCIPSDMATGDAAQIEEERRLLYVALTRARQHLHVLVPQRFYVSGQTGDRHVYAGLTRFITDADGAFERVGPRPAAAAAVAPALPPLAAIDIAGRLRGSWSGR